MSVINPANTIEFKSTDALFARVRKRLRSFDMAGVLDEGDWYQYVKEVLDSLGVGVYKESEAVLVVKNFKAPLPDDFSYLYAAYKCTSSAPVSHQTKFPQTGFVYYIEEACQKYRYNRGCSAARKEYISGEKITITPIIEGTPTTPLSFEHPRLLQLAGNVRSICDKKCENLAVKSAHQISINNGFVHTNFNDDSIYMKYYAFPVDGETGLPMIPDVSVIEKAVEDFIIYSVFNDFVINGEISDIERKFAIVRANHEESYANARTYVKMPSFQTMINKIRHDRKNLGFYQM